MNWLLRWPSRWYLAGLVVVGGVVRYIHLATSSIWHDEGYTMMLAPQSPAQIILRTGRDVHPPLYYLALHYWMLVFGNSETAARGLSAVLMLLCIPMAYLLIRRLYNNETASRLAALFVALGPFLVRYGQEARMYGMVASLALLATYCMVKALNSKQKVWWAAYAVSLAAALYTHYYAIFMVPVHWLYVIWRSSPGQGLRSRGWWLANVGTAAFFAPWLPVAYHQFSRVQRSFWIPKPTADTLPNTVVQFLAYNNLNRLATAGKVLIVAVFGLLVAYVLIRRPLWRRATILMVAYAALAPLLVFLLSFKRPIYVDRYFVFAAVAYYLLLGIVIAVGPLASRPRLQAVATLVVSGLLVSGIIGVYTEKPHQMRVIGQVINSNYQRGDDIVSGELYTYFDFTYYNHTGYLLKLLAPNGVDGYGESSLIYDRSDQIIVRNYSQLHPASGYVWIVGKTGNHNYFNKVPANWTPVGPHYTAGYCAAQRYRVGPRNGGLALVQ